MAEEIQIRGIEEVCALLDSAPSRIVKHAFARALAAAAVPIVQELEARAPAHTGDMKAHLIADIAVDQDGKGGQAQIGFGKQGYIARLVEFGHRMIGHRPNKKELGSVPCHPFMRPAAEAAAQAAVDAFTESMQESLREDI